MRTAVFCRLTAEEGFASFSVSIENLEKILPATVYTTTLREILSPALADRGNPYSFIAGVIGPCFTTKL